MNVCGNGRTDEVVSEWLIGRVDSTVHILKTAEDQKLDSFEARCDRRIIESVELQAHER